MSTRAERRRRQRTPVSTQRKAAAASVFPALRRGSIARLACVALAAVTLAILGRFLWLQITWYLAVDQFGYLTFAHDLLRGRIFHQWELADALGTSLPSPTDAFAQTYIWDHGRMFCRYGIGFPLILATWIRLFGDNYVHYLNPLIFIGGLALLTAFELRISHSPWRALACLLLPLLCRQTMMHLWALTLTRDMVAHVTSLLGLFLLLPMRGRALTPRRAALAFLPLGFAWAIRPDAPLYLLPATLLVGLRLRREGAPNGRRTLGAAALAGYLIGALPYFVYNTIAVGNPLRSTQAMEIQQFLSDLGDLLTSTAWAAGWHGGAFTQVQGGGLRLAYFRTTFPGVWRIILAGYGPLLVGAMALGAFAAAVRRRVLFVATVPYVVTAVLFFSCWARPDTRYLVGVWFYLPLLIVEGTVGALDLVRWIARQERELVARVVATALALAAVILGVAAYRVSPEGSLLGVTNAAVATVVAGGAGAAVVWPRRRIVAFAAPLLALALTAYFDVTTYQGLRRVASFQRQEAERARATLRAAVTSNAVVLTTEDVGRPAENVEYYGGIPALYTTDLRRWNLKVPRLALGLLATHRRLYLLLPPHGEIDRIRRDLPPQATLEEVRDIPAQEAMSYFVAAPFHRGVPMKLWRLQFGAIEEKISEAIGYIP
ncbi:MAG: hypothetical protein U0807_05055 [Candidatus Binatia bacterium]